MGLLDFANPGQDKLTPQFLDVLNTVAGNYGGLRITSGYRDPAYNAKVGGAKGSRHTHGDASDIDLSGLSDEQRIALVNDLRGKGAKGFIAYSKSPNMLHVDMGIPGVRPNEHFMFDRSAKNMSNAPAWFQQAASGGAGTQGIADDAMAAIGKQPMQRGTQTAIGGSGADTMDTPRQGLLGQIARPDEKVGGLLGMMFGNMSPDRADQLRANIGGLMGINNQGMVDGARGRMRARSGARENDLNYNRKQQQVEQERARAIDFFKSQGDTGGMFADAIAAGGNPGQIIESFVRTASTANDPAVQSSQMMPDQSGTIFNMRDGSLQVVTIGGETLTGQAAVDFVRTAQENYTNDQRSIYSARQDGRNQADIESGGTAAATIEAATNSINLGKEAWSAYGQLNSSISTMDEAIAALDAGGKSGAFQKFLPNITESSARLNNAMDRMGLDVISATTFGALSEGELRLAMETAVPRNLDEAELRSWLTRRRDAQAKAADMLANAAQYLSTPGNNLKGWIDQNRGSSTPAPTGGGMPAAAAPVGDDDLLKMYGE